MRRFGMPSAAEQAQREYESELDQEAAKIIREQGVPLWDAIIQARNAIQRRRQYGIKKDKS